MSSEELEGVKSAKHAKHAKHAKTKSSPEKGEVKSAAPKHGKAAKTTKAAKPAAASKAAKTAKVDDAPKAAKKATPVKSEVADTAKVAKKTKPETAKVPVVEVEPQPQPEETQVVPVVGEQKQVAPVEPVAVQEEKEPKDYTKLKKSLAIGFGSFFALLLVVYIAGVAFFSGRLYPNTKLGDMDVSMKTSADLSQLLNDRIEGYSLTVTNKDGFTQTISSTDIGLTLDGNINLSQLVPERTSLTWPVDVFLTHDISRNVGTSYNLMALQSLVGGAVRTFNETATAPVSAKIAYNTTTKQCEIVPEVYGTALDESAVNVEVAKAVESLTKELVLGQESLQKPRVIASDERMASALSEAAKMCKADVTYTLGGTEVAHVNPTLILTWITLDEDCKAALDDALLTEWATATATPLNTVGSERTYTRVDGKVITVSGGDYGWEVDVPAFVEQVRADVAEGGTKTSAIPCTEEGEGTGFSEVGGADWGKRYVDVDLEEQFARFYDSDGSIIWEADFVSGAPTADRATPTGVYYIKMKESPSKLVGYLPNGKKDYETVVTYWMPFIRNEIGFHDATWQPGFGGSMYRNGYGSHGCINISYGDAQSLYSIVQPNDVVVVHG